MRVIFMGTPDFAVPTLDALVEAGHEILAVVAQPDKPSGRGQRLQAPPTVVRAHELGLPTRQPRGIRSGPFPAWMAQADADVAVVVAYGRILTPQLLAAPRLGCINVHASLLPKYRGAAPIQWSVIHGEPVTGITTMQMDVGLDTGDMLLQRETPIGPDETAGQLWDRLKHLGAETLIETLARLDTLTPVPQDPAQATHAPMLEKAHGTLDWTASAQQVHDRIRGVNPWPGAATGWRDETLKLWESQVVAAPAAGQPGEILETRGALVVACGQGAVSLLSVQRAGKRAQPGPAFVQGARIEKGEILG